MKWNIITDSSCDLYHLDEYSEKIRFASIPFIINIENRDFVDDEKLNTAEMVAVMEKCREVSHTSCPAPYAWYEQFEKEEYSIAITISSKLSGSYNSACTARNMILEKYPDKKIAVIDSRSTGSEMVLIVMKLCKLINAGYDFNSVIEKTEQYMKHTHIVFALSSFDNLINNGRMSRITGFLAGKLGFLGIGIGSEQGTIEIKEKVRGNKKALNAILKDIKERAADIETVVISHCQNAEFAESLKNAIQNICHTVEVKIMPTRGLCSYYAEKGGLIIGF